MCTGPWTDFNSFVFFFRHRSPRLGGPGLSNCGLSEDECQLVQRFDPTRLHDAQTDQTNTLQFRHYRFFYCQVCQKVLLKEEIKKFKSTLTLYLESEKLPLAYTRY